jgi:hypothetical protein
MVGEVKRPEYATDAGRMRGANIQFFSMQRAVARAPRQAQTIQTGSSPPCFDVSLLPTDMAHAAIMTANMSRTAILAILLNMAPPPWLFIRIAEADRRVTLSLIFG